MSNPFKYCDSKIRIRVVLFSDFIPLVVLGALLIAIAFLTSDLWVDYSISALQNNRQDIHQYTSIVMGGAMAIGVVSLAVGICGVVACSKWKFPVRKWKTIFIMLPMFQTIVVVVGLTCFFFIYSTTMQYYTSFCSVLKSSCDSFGYDTPKCSITERQFNYWCLYRFPLMNNLAMYATIATTAFAFFGNLLVCWYTEITFGRTGQANPDNLVRPANELPSEMKSSTIV